MVVLLTAAMILIYIMIKCCRAFCSLVTKLIVVPDTDIGVVDAPPPDGIDANKLLHVLSVLHDQKWVGRPSASRLQCSVDSSVAPDVTLSDDGVGAGPMVNAVEIAATEGWIEASSFVLEHWNKDVNVHCTVMLSQDTVHALLSRAPLGHMIINMQGQSEVKVSTTAKVLHIIGGDFGAFTVPATVHTLKMVNNDTLSSWNEGLTVLDLMDSGLAQSFGLNAIPRTVRHLILPHRYAHTIGILPPDLKYLYIGLTYNQALGPLPDTLEELVMMHDDEQPYRPTLSHLPAALRVLQVRVDNVLCITQAASDEYPTVLQLPPQLEVLHVKHLQGRLYMLPASLKVLCVDGMTYNEPLGLLPPTLEELDLSHADSFQQPLGAIPSTLKCIRLKSEYTQALQGVPPDATVQYIRTSYSEPYLQQGVGCAQRFIALCRHHT
jgi:hypothetical protein